MNILNPLIWEAIKHHKKYIFGVILLGNIGLLFDALAVVYFQKIIDRVPQLNSFDQLMPIFLVYAFFAIVPKLIWYIDNYPNQMLSRGLEQWTKVFALEKISKLDYLAYQNLGTGKLVQIIENGSKSMKEILAGFYVRILKELLPTAVFSLIFIRNYDKNIFLLLIGGYVVVFAISFWLLKWLRSKRERILTHQEDFSRFSIRGFMELVVFRINKRFKDEIDRVNSLSEGIVKTQAQIKIIHELFFTLFALLVVAIQLGIVFYQVNQIILGLSTIGTLVALVSLVQKVYNPVAIFNVAFVDYKLNQLPFQRFEKFINLPNDSNVGNDKKITIDKGEISFEEVTFGYQDRNILNNFSLVLQGRKSTAIVGTTGAGKSTIAKLIVSLLKPQSGKVLIDGQNIAEVSLNSLYDHIVYLSQDAPIIDGTVRENLVFNRKVTNDDLFAVLKKVKLDTLVSNLPEGLDTEIGERGLKLSGGEKQRLGFARIFLMEPEIVVLDEPTSALDSTTEEFITNHMVELFNGKTLIVIAHRLQTVRNVDRIIVMEEGNIIEEGDFNTLHKQDGKFKELWNKQTKMS